MNIQEFEYKADQAAALMKSLGSRPRLMLLCHLSDGEKSVGELAEHTGLRMSAVSQNLALLRAERIVSQRRDGTTVYYRLADPTVRQLIRVLYRAFCEGERAKRLG
ncbi:MAG: metalloregulator ArsR/SmtB family transcription factor [Pseudorhodoplanes sp.]|nr:metalloregulator ArsR/SmtB family transcription factor [Pseudorhodoplanes sp.]